MTQTRKFSQFDGPSPIQAGDIVVGLRDVNGVPVNFQFTGVGSGGGGGSGTSITLLIQQPGHGLQPGDWIRMDTSGLYVKAIALDAQQAEIAGCVLNDANFTPDQFTIQVIGFVDTGTFAGMMPGQVWFLSDSTLGAMSLDEPIIDGEVSIPVFIATSATQGWIRQWRGIIVSGQQIPAGGGGSENPNIVTVHQPGHNLNLGDFVRLAGSINYVQALADTKANAQVVGVVIEVVGPDDFVLQTSGYNIGAVQADENGVALVPATVYYLTANPLHPGRITSIEPSTVGQATKPVFVCEQAAAPATTAGYIYEQRPLTVEAPPSTDNPIVKTITQAGHGFTFIGQVVKASTVTPGQYVAANASNITTSYAVGMIKDILDANTFIVQEVGYLEGLGTIPTGGGVVNPAFPLNIGVPYFLSTAVGPSGQITNIEPTNPNYTKPMFEADQTGAGWIFPMKPTIGAGGGGGGGAIVQCIAYQDQTIHNVSYSSAAYSSIPFITGTITPTSNTSKIRITICTTVNQQYSSAYSLFRGVTQLPDNAHFMWLAGPLNGAATGQSVKTLTFMYIDSPASTAALTYNLRIISTQPIGVISAGFNNTAIGVPAVTSWTLEEIAV